jgi:hypothetical protein
MGRFEINSRKPSTFEVAVKGTRQIRVILYAKGDLGARAPADELPIEDILAIEHDVIPLDGADVFQQGGIDSIGERIAIGCERTGLYFEAVFFPPATV